MILTNLTPGVVLFSVGNDWRLRASGSDCDRGGAEGLYAFEICVYNDSCILRVFLVLGLGCEFVGLGVC